MKILSNYLAVEGLDGSGKSSVVRALHDRLVATNDQVIAYHDAPYGDNLGRIVNGIWQEPHGFDDETLLLLAAAASIRAQRLLPAEVLSGSQGVVISDRCPIGTYAYLQSVQFDHFLDVHRGFLFPRTTVLLTVEVELAVERLIARGASSQELRVLRDQFPMVTRRYADVASRIRDLGGSFVVMPIAQGITADDIAERIVPVFIP